MTKQRMRYRWWSERVPRNVNRQQLNRYEFTQIAMVLTGLLSAGTLVMAVIGVSSTSDNLAQVDAMTIASAIAHQGDPIELVKLEGFLVADDAPTMPDDDGLTVIRGQVLLTARTIANRNQDEEEVQRETLLDWQQDAEQVYLSDGDARLPLAFDATQLPLPDAEAPANNAPKLERTGPSARNQIVTGVRYADTTYSLSLGEANTRDGITIDLERKALSHGQAAVVVAGLRPTATGNQLVDPLGDRLVIALGTETEIKTRERQTRKLFAMLWLPLAIISYLLYRVNRGIYWDMVRQSNEP